MVQKEQNIKVQSGDNNSGSSQSCFKEKTKHVRLPSPVATTEQGYNKELFYYYCSCYNHTT